MDHYDKTIETYNAVAQVYEDKYMTMDLYNASYDAFCERVPENGTVLELASGPGNIARYVLNKRPDLSYLATDAAENMVALAGKNLPEATVTRLDFRNVSELKQKFDGIICGFGLPYLAKEDCVKLIRDCVSLLSESGTIYLSFVPGSYEDSKQQISKDGKHTVFFHFYEREFIVNELEKNGLKITANLEVDFKRSETVSEIHSVLIASK